MTKSKLEQIHEDCLEFHYLVRRFIWLARRTIPRYANSVAKVRFLEPWEACVIDCDRLYVRICRAFAAVAGALPEHVDCFRKTARVFLALSKIAHVSFERRRPKCPMTLPQMLLITPLSQKQAKGALAHLGRCVARMQEEFVGKKRRTEKRKRRKSVRQVSREPGTPVQNIFRKKGQVWEVSFERQDFNLRSSKGAAYLHLLLLSPGQRISVADLAFRVAKAPQQFPLGNAGERNDEEARAAYEIHYRDLEEELAKAQRNEDDATSNRVNREMEFLAAELKERGWGGRRKRERDDQERLRKAVQASIRRVRNEIARHNKLLRDHLRHHLRCGTHPCYTPPAGVCWRT